MTKAKAGPKKGPSENSLRNLKPAKKGEVRNPSGVTIPKDIAAMRAFNNIDVERTLNGLLRLNIREIKARIDNPETPAIEQLIGTVLYKGVKQGDTVRATWILERAGCRLPPMVQPIALTVTAQLLKDMPQGELIDLGAEAIAVLQEAEKAKHMAEGGIYEED